MKHEFPKKTRILARHRCAGLSIVEMLMALAITAMLLTATCAAVAASFRAYADAATQSGSQSAGRLVTHRLLTLVRTSVAHGPLNADASVTPAATISGNTISSPYIELLDMNGNLVRMEYHPLTQELWLVQTPAGSATAISQPILGGVTAAQFTLVRRRNDDGLWVLSRGTVDLTLSPNQDTTLALEHGKSTPIRFVASTKPRRLDD